MSEHDEMYFQLGKNIRGLRKAFGETQDELAMSVNVTKSAISLYERSESPREIFWSESPSITESRSTIFCMETFQR